MTEDTILTIKEAAAYFKVSPNTLWRLARSGEVRSLKIGKIYRFILKELEEDLRKQLEP